MGWQMPYSANLDLYVEVAWGATVGSSPAGWTWTDITSDVRVSDGININAGRSDEQSASSPTQLSITLSNPDGRYLTGPGPNYPNVRRNVPVRVRTVGRSSGGTFVTIFYGYATSWSPTFRPTGVNSTVKLTAHGCTRRLNQGSGIADSAMTRYLRARTSLVEWWPLEDTESSVIGLSALPGGSGMTYMPGTTPKSKVVSSDEAPSGATRSAALTQGAALSGAVRSYNLGSTWAVGFSMLLDHTVDADRFVKIEMAGSSGSYVQMRVFTINGGDPGVQISGFSSAVPGGESWSGYQGVGSRDWTSGGKRWYHFVLTVNATDIFLAVLPDPLDSARRIYTQSYFLTDTLVHPSAPTRIEFGSVDGSDLEVGLSQVFVGNAYSSYGLTLNPNPQSGWISETTTARVLRLAAEENLTTTVYGGTSDANAMAMGSQPAASVLSLLRECEVTEQGLLLDGMDGVDLAWVPKRQFEANLISLSTPASAMAEPFGPIDDDQRLRNVVAAKREGGAEQVYHEVNGPMGTDTVGEYSTSVTVNAPADGDVLAYAQWITYLGTRTGYRWPTVTLPHYADSNTIYNWKPGNGMAVTNPGAVLPGVVSEDLQLLIEGLSISISEALWRTTITCSPLQPWLSALIGAETTSETSSVARATTDGSALDSPATAGATSLSVATPSGPLWTTAADDFYQTNSPATNGLQISVGGYRCRVTNISGGSSPQTFTVASPGLPAACAAGAVVDLWNQPVLGL